MCLHIGCNCLQQIRINHRLRENRTISASRVVQMNPTTWYFYMPCVCVSTTKLCLCAVLNARIYTHKHRVQRKHQIEQKMSSSSTNRLDSVTASLTTPLKEKLNMTDFVEILVFSSYVLHLIYKHPNNFDNRYF